MVEIIDDIAEGMPLKPTLESINGAITQIVGELNELIDEEFAIQETLRLLDYYTELNEKYKTQFQAFVAQLMELRQAYVTLNAKYRGSKDSTIKAAKKLYAVLLKKYTEKAKTGDGVLCSVGEWEIPQQFQVPKPCIPKHGSQRSSAMLSLSRKVFNTRYHYHSRAHWTISRAVEHKQRLVIRLNEEKAKHFARQQELKQLEQKIQTAQEQIDITRFRLLEDPPHHIWFHTYEAHANFVRNILECIHNENHYVRTLQCYSRVQPTEHEIKPIIFPAPSTLRRMSGPDINKAPELSTISTGQPQYKHIRQMRSFQSQDTQDPQRNSGKVLDGLFQRPMHVRYSRSMLDLKSPAAVKEGKAPMNLNFYDQLDNQLADNTGGISGFTTLAAEATTLRVTNFKSDNTSYHSAQAYEPAKELEEVASYQISSTRGHELVETGQNVSSYEKSAFDFDQLTDEKDSIGSVYDDVSERILSTQIGTPDTPAEQLGYLKPLYTLPLASPIEPLRVPRMRHQTSTVAHSYINSELKQV